ncbi:MAG: N-acetylmannosamine-6-phosphate 2-epimerase [Mycoplasmoidaceae bacterium]
MNKKIFLTKIKGNLIVSCQAVDNEPLNNVTAITLMAKAVIEGGAKVLRLSQFNHIKSIKNKFPQIPIIGLIKKKYENSDVFITPTKKEINQLLKLEVDCIALDATLRTRPKESLNELIKYIRAKNKNVAIMADCSDEEDVLNANQYQFDLIGTTLRGYTKKSQGKNNIDNNYKFIKWCVKNSKIPIIAEGGIWTPIQAKEILSLNVHAVVIGSAITRPKEITQYFLKEVYNGQIKQKC